MTEYSRELMRWARRLTSSSTPPADPSSFCTGFDYGLELAMRRPEYAKKLHAQLLADTHEVAVKGGASPESDDHSLAVAFDALQMMLPL